MNEEIKPIGRLITRKQAVKIAKKHIKEMESNRLKTARKKSKEIK